jgi:hypothetical protein
MYDDTRSCGQSVTCACAAELIDDVLLRDTPGRSAACPSSLSVSYPMRRLLRCRSKRSGGVGEDERKMGIGGQGHEEEVVGRHGEPG